MRTPGNEIDSGYIIARTILLDALSALAHYGPKTVIVVGAQAIYLRCEGEDGIPVAPFTLDSDLVVDLKSKTSKRPIREYLESLGYESRDEQPGLYQAPGLPREAQEAG